VLNQANSEKLSSAAAIVLVERLALLKDRLNRVDRTKPVINLTDADKEQLRPLVEYVRDSVLRGPSWRWYLAATVLDEVDAAAFLDTIPSLNRALYTNDPMLQYGAVKALYHNARHQETQEAKTGLLDLLYRPRPPFQAIYLRGKRPYLRGSRLIEENRVSYTNDVRVYSDVDTQDDYRRRERGFGIADLLISDTLLHLGATYDEIGPRLSDLAAREISSIRLRAIRQLVQLGPAGQQTAAINLRQLLLDRDKYLMRSLADEHPALVGRVPLDDPEEQRRTVNVFNELGESTKLVVGPLAGLLHQGDDRVRHVTADILGRIGTQDISAALMPLQVALASEVIAPLTDLMTNKEFGKTASELVEEITQHKMVVSVDKLQSIRDELIFDYPLRPSQEECFRAMLDAAVKLQSAKNDAGSESTE
jgi:hypothetical protein